MNDPMKPTPWTPPASFASVVPALVQADGWMLDVDGCLVRTSQAGGSGGSAIEGAAELLGWLRRHGKDVVVCTNASQRPVRTYAAHLRAIGLDVADEDMMTAATAAADHIATHHPGARVLVVGDEGLREAVSERGLVLADPRDTDADVVVVGAADSFQSAHLNGACLSIADHGAPLYVSVDTPWFHGGVKRSVASSSAIAMAISAVTGVRAQVCGKPSQAIGEVLRRRLGGAGRRLVVVGDMASIEVQLAHQMGALGVLVMSGGTSMEQLPHLPPAHRPDWVGRDVGELVQQLKAVQA
ncbi:HAD hydrolase-like protein [Hydrogenophaga sp.]|uniref:HAD-IIA family hydrolase n=1 Tax=Hydrogenophaga sp. TaxID=1904254 RepID=UPI002629BF10|nr:HAD hydrolase-like protein [Hydrogenophaga sp.]MCW5653684.1 HAD hydrolase-like protein [Hydrogenophaga sp.]